MTLSYPLVNAIRLDVKEAADLARHCVMVYPEAKQQLDVVGKKRWTVIQTKLKLAAAKRCDSFYLELTLDASAIERALCSFFNTESLCDVIRNYSDRIVKVAVDSDCTSIAR